MDKSTRQMLDTAVAAYVAAHARASQAKADQDRARALALEAFALGEVASWEANGYRVSVVPVERRQVNAEALRAILRDRVPATMLDKVFGKVDLDVLDALGLDDLGEAVTVKPGQRVEVDAL